MRDQQQGWGGGKGKSRVDREREAQLLPLQERTAGPRPEEAPALPSQQG